MGPPQPNLKCPRGGFKCTNVEVDFGLVCGFAKTTKAEGKEGKVRGTFGNGVQFAQGRRCGEEGGS